MADFEEMNRNYSSAWLNDDDIEVEIPEGCEPKHVVCHVTRFNVKGKVGREWQHVQQALLPCFSLFRMASLVAPAAKRHLCVTRSGASQTDVVLSHAFTQFQLSVAGVEGREAGGRLCERRHAEALCAAHVAHVPPLPWRQWSLVSYMNGLRDKEVKWLRSPEDAAWMQRAANLTENSTDAVRVGVLDRNARRWGDDALAFATSVNTRLAPDIVAEVMLFEGTSPEDQAKWTYAQDVIISPHGAQLSNLIFARRCTVVVEIFPENYYLPGFYGTLAREIGAVYVAVSDGKGGYQPVSRNAGFVHLEPDVMFRILPGLVKHRRWCLEGQPARPSEIVDADGPASPADPAAALSSVRGDIAALRAKLDDLEKEETRIRTALGAISETGPAAIARDSARRRARGRRARR